MRAYKYNGAVEVEIPQVGTFQPGETKEVDIEINHPDFELVSGKRTAEPYNEPRVTASIDEEETKKGKK